MSEQNSLHQAGPTLNAEWVRLLAEIDLHYSNGNYMGAWKSFQLLQSTLPIECYKATKPEHDKITQFIEKLRDMGHPSYFDAAKYFKKHLDIYLETALLVLNRTVHTNLEETGWITKEQNTGRPAYGAVGHLGNEPR